jgi:trans-aconitate methyltransferase
MRNPACMNDPIRQLYQTRIYPAMSHPPADPAVSGVAALLGGLDVRVPSKARVIEIGCASGHNLIPLAMRWPESRFVGIDLSEAAIQQARDLAEAAGAGNVAFQTADLRDFEDGEPYDFIIAHGFSHGCPTR